MNVRDTKREFTVHLRGGEIVTIRRHNVAFRDGWVIFSNGREYEAHTATYALPAAFVEKVEEFDPQDTTPVAPPLSGKTSLVEGKVYDPDDDEYHPR